MVKRWQLGSGDMMEAFDASEPTFVLASDYAALEARIAALEALLRKCKRPHYRCDDSWYSCPKDEEGCSNEEEGTECNCGADEFNAIIDAALCTPAAPTGESLPS
jgi:hypothetical protein